MEPVEPMASLSPEGNVVLDAPLKDFLACCSAISNLRHRDDYVTCSLRGPNFSYQTLLQQNGLAVKWEAAGRKDHVAAVGSRFRHDVTARK